MGRGILGSIVLIGLGVMIYYGRVTWMAGGGVVLPQVTTTFAAGSRPSSCKVTLRNTGSEPLRNLRGATDKWNLDMQFPIVDSLQPGESFQFECPALTEGDSLFLFADKYVMPAMSRVHFEP